MKAGISVQSDDFQINYKPLKVTFIVEKIVAAEMFAVPSQIDRIGGGLDLHSYYHYVDLEIPYPPQVARARSEKLSKAVIKVLQKLLPDKKKMLLPMDQKTLERITEQFKGIDNQPGDYRILVRYSVNAKHYWCGTIESQSLWIRIKNNGNPLGLQQGKALSPRNVSVGIRQ